MIGRLAFVLVLLFHPGNLTYGQAVKLPRDFSKLVSRAQDFWTAMSANQRLKALDFVLPDKKEFLLSSGAMPFVNPQIVGIDFAGDVNHAAVRVSVTAIAQAAPSGRLSWIVTDTWVWDRNNWFLDLQDPKTESNPFFSSKKVSRQPDPLLAEAAAQFKLLDTLVDVGTVPRGDLRKIPIHLEYTGDQGIYISSDLASEVLSLDAASSQYLTSRTKELALLLDTESWDGPFVIPFPLKVHYKGVTLDRTVVVRGTVSTAISITQQPATFTNAPGQDLTLVLKNNTAQLLSILSVGSEAVFNVVRLPEPILPGNTGELILRLNSTAQADVNQRIRLNLSEPFMGKQDYYVTLRVRPTP